MKQPPLVKRGESLQSEQIPCKIKVHLSKKLWKLTRSHHLESKKRVDVAKPM